jgi:hypothetical protein
MTFVCLQLLFLQDVYDHQHMFLKYVLFDDDRVEFYVLVNLLNILNILNS